MASLRDCWLEMCRRNVMTAPAVSNVFVRRTQDKTVKECPAELEWLDPPIERDGFRQVGWLYVDGLVVGPLSGNQEIETQRFAVYDLVPMGTRVARYKTNNMIERS